MEAGQLITWAAVCSITTRIVECRTHSPSLEAELVHYVTKRPVDYDDHTNASAVEKMIRADVLKAMDKWNWAPETPEPEFDSYGNKRTPEPKEPQFWNAYRQAREGDRPSSWDRSDIDYESCLRRKNQEWTPSQESPSRPYNGSTHEPFTWRTHYNTSSVEDYEVWTQPNLDTLETLEANEQHNMAGRGGASPMFMNGRRNNNRNRNVQRRKQSLKHLLRHAAIGQRSANGMKPDMQWSEVPRSQRRKSNRLHAERMRLRGLDTRKGGVARQQSPAESAQRRQQSPLLTAHIIRTVGLQAHLQSG